MNRSFFFRYFFCVFISCTFSIASASAQNNNRLVELEVYSTPTTAATTQHQWLEALSEVNADRVTLKTARKPSPSVEETTYGGSKVILVKGVISDRKIKLPKKTFSINDKRGIKNYLQSLRADGPKTTLAKKGAFGLTSDQLVDIRAKLAGVVSSSSKNEKSGRLIDQMIRTLRLNTNLSPSARTVMRSEQKVSNEYQGLSVGTALSVELRRHDLVLRPSPKQGRGVELEIVPTSLAPQSWPQGWPTNAVPVSTFPKLFEVTALQLNNIQLDSVLDAISRRLKIEFIVDPAAWGAKPVDLSTVRVTYNKARSSYSAAIGNILSQSKPRLHYKIRLDENEKPFIWITGN
jgi:hypothetical protein